MSSFADSEKRLLLSIARGAVVLAVERRANFTEFPADSFLHQPGGAFVTLRMRRRLRGCIGRLHSPFSRDSLAETIASCARSAALEDPRFSPVRPAELLQIEIELSILSRVFPITPEEIVPGRHGLLVSHGPFRGVLLPQVALEFRWQALRFLEETCVKAGLVRDAWRDPDTSVEAFTAEVFSEREFAAESSAGPGNSPGLGKYYSSST
jgi:AmmeMemoRadiSam system protein A